jgi:hypothetical protein
MVRAQLSLRRPDIKDPNTTNRDTVPKIDENPMVGKKVIKLN